MIFYRFTFGWNSPQRFWDTGVKPKEQSSCFQYYVKLRASKKQRWSWKSSSFRSHVHVFSLQNNLPPESQKTFSKPPAPAPHFSAARPGFPSTRPCHWTRTARAPSAVIHDCFHEKQWSLTCEKTVQLLMIFVVPIIAPQSNTFSANPWWSKLDGWRRNPWPTCHASSCPTWAGPSDRQHGVFIRGCRTLDHTK